MKKWRESIVLCLTCMAMSLAQGAEMPLAKIERDALPPLADQAAFDRASRQAILSYARELASYERAFRADVEFSAQIKQHRVDPIPVRRFINRTWQELLNNYRQALKTCGDCAPVATIDDLRRLADEAQIPAAQQAFYETYFAEQSRLGNLFRTTSSEIDTFNDNEIDGSTFADMSFMFSFDDGPSDQYGNTDRLIESLHRLDLHAVFFALGEKLVGRQGSKGDLAPLYANQCLASHGQKHQSHAKIADWQTSVLGSLDVAKAAAPEAWVAAFRPPYGQRKSDSGDFFKQHGIKVVLWNIDSQDWQKNIDAEHAANRVVALMLLKRKGIVLFHDIHAKAIVAVPGVVKALENTGVKWLDCRNSAELTR